VKRINDIHETKAYCRASEGITADFSTIEFSAEVQEAAGLRGRLLVHATDVLSDVARERLSQILHLYETVLAVGDFKEGLGQREFVRCDILPE